MTRCAYVAAIAASAILWSAPSVAGPAQRFPVAAGVTAEYPPGWTVGPPQYTNATTLIRSALTPPPATAARVLVTAAARASHADAVEQLGEIAAEIPAPPTFLTLCGWPALQRRYRMPMEQPGLDPDEGAAALSLRVTVAVAVDSVLVRIQGTIPPGGDEAAADEIEGMGRSLTCDSLADAQQVTRDLDRLRRWSATPRISAPLSPAPPPARKAERLRRERPVAEGGAAALPGVPQQIQAGVGELELIASSDGKNVVMAANSGFANSTDGGLTFTPRGGTPLPPGFFSRNGDPSLAWGPSAAFYYAFIGFPTGTNGPPSSRFQCSTTVGRSTDNGQSFTTFSNATLCDNTNGPICFPDQEHIAADRVTAAAGGDQVYSVWRNFSGGNCDTVSGPVIPSIVCSQDNGGTWSAATVIENGGDFPRVTVGQDGFVYVVYRVGGNIRINKFSSCTAGLAQQAMFPRTVTAVADVACPVAGLDRCNNGNTLSSHMAAVDDTNANHVFVAYATSAGAANETVRVIDSADGGVNWGAAVQVNGGGVAARFMPWVCSAAGAARVAWYDRRAGNDSTDYYCGSAADPGGGLVAGTEVNVTNNPDPQCNSGWPCAPRATGDSETCPTQPQLAGVCCTAALQGSTCPAGSGSGTRCDFSDGCTVMGETCRTGGGCPKYGDYNGNACAAGRVFTAWSSATPPMGLPNPGGLAVFSDSKLANQTAGVDLAVSKVDNPDPVVAGMTLVYTITVTNNGPATALNVQVTDMLPATVEFLSNPAPTGWMCMNPPLNTSGTITCTTGVMGIGEVAMFTVTVAVAANQAEGSMLSNTAAASSQDTDPSPASMTIMTSVTRVADLAIVKTDKPDPVIIGSDIIYTVTVVNNGPSDADDATVTDTVPTNTTFVSVGTSPGWACITPPVGGTGVVSCTKAPFVVGEMATITLRVRVNAGLPSGTVIDNLATASSTTTDPDGSNNPSSAATRGFLPVPTLGSVALGMTVLLIGLAGARALRQRRRVR